ncbi:ABC transporter permease [bacterium]|nr:ABC transporter permease [bacterium]
MKIGDIIFALSQAFKSFVRRGFITFLSITTITTALVVFGIFGIISSNLRYSVNKLKKRVGIEIYIKENIDEKRVQDLIQRIESKPEIDNVIYISRDKALQKFKVEYGEELLQHLDENPFPASLQLRLKAEHLGGTEINALTEEFSGYEEVDDISSEGRIATKISKMAKTFQLLEISWGILLFIAATIIILNTIKFTIAARKSTIEIMELVGATRTFIQRPFIYEGMLKGLLSGIFASVIIYGIEKLIRIVLPQFVSMSDLGLFLIVILGIFFGGIGSKLAVRKFL